MARRAVLVGATYADNAHLPTLGGAVNDVLQAKIVLTTLYGFAETDVCLLVDGQVDAGCPKVCTIPPTKCCILSALDWLVKGACAGDVLFFHYSGYGTRVPESPCGDTLEEALLPSDATLSDVCGYGNVISHAEFSAKFAAIPKDVTVVQVFDTAFNGADKCAQAAVQHSVLCHGLSTKVVAARGVDNVASISACKKLKPEGRFTSVQFPIADACKALCFDLPSAWVACGEDQTTWDAVIDCKATGVLSHYLYDTVVSQHKIDHQNQNVCILNAVTYAICVGGFAHRPDYVVADSSKKLAKFIPAVPEKKKEEVICPPAPCLTKLQEVAIACLKKEVLCGTDEALVEELATRVALLTTVTVERQCLSQRLISLVNAKGHWILREIFDVCAPAGPCPQVCLPACPPVCLPACPPVKCVPELDARQLYFVEKIVSHAKLATSACRVEELAKRLTRCSGYGLTLTEQQVIVDELACLIEDDGWVLLRLLFASAPPADLKLPQKVVCPPAPEPVPAPCPVPEPVPEPVPAPCPPVDCTSHLRTLISLMGLEGYELGLKFKSEYACMTVEQRKGHYKTLYCKAGIEAVTAAAAIAGETCYMELLAAAVGEQVHPCCLPPAVPPPVPAVVSVSLKCQLLQSVMSLAGARGHEIAVRLSDCVSLIAESEKKSLYVELLKLGGVTALASGVRLAADVEVLKTVVAAAERVRLVRCEPPVDICTQREVKRQKEKHLLKEVIVVAGCEGYELSVKLMEVGVTVTCRREIYSKLFLAGGFEAVTIAALVSEDEDVKTELVKAGEEHAAFVQCPIVCAPAVCCPPAVCVPLSAWECDYLLSTEERRIVTALYFLAREDCTIRLLATKLALEKKVLSHETQRSIIAQIICKTGCEGLELVQKLC